MPHPGYADPLADLQSLDAGADEVDASDYLVTWDNGKQGIGQLPVHNVQIGPTDPARGYANADLACAGLSVRQFHRQQSAPQRPQDHRVHALTS
jgi:hypothetical protein